jgi:hypothetical protein
VSDPASLANLHGIVLPEPVPWWPPAPGWYWLGGALAAAAAWLAVRALRRWHADAYRRAALAELDAIGARAEAPDAGADALRALPALLKRAALAAYPRERVAALSGPRWWAFLDATGGGTAFGGGAGPRLDALGYDPAASLEPEGRRELLAASRTWLRRHRRGAGPAAC